MERLTLHNQDCMTILQTLPSKSIDLIATDPPYFRVKANDWDNQWPNEQAFFGWLETIIRECARVLKDIGSIYLFASPQLSSKVEALIAKHFCINNHIIWVKTSGMFKRQCKSNLRRYFPQTERIIFASAKFSNENRDRNRAYADACSPIIDHFNDKRHQVGLTQSQVNKQLGTQMAGHWFGRSQWRLPSAKVYAQLQNILPLLTRRYEEIVGWRDELLDKHQNPSRRYFNVSDGWYTDIWECGPVQYYEGKHPCEKPQKIMEQIIKSSSQEGDLVLDPFLGGGATGVATLNNGRRFIGCELDDGYFTTAKARLTSL